MHTKYINQIIENDIGSHTYIECACTNFDHLCRLGYLKDDDNKLNGEFYLEFKHHPYPVNIKGISYTCSNFIFHIKKTWSYLKNIWYAIKGKPNRYSNIAYWDDRQATQIKEFIEHCITRYKLN